MYSLTKIYNGLCECCSKPKSKCLRARQRRTATSRTQPSLNPYETLAIENGSLVGKDDTATDQIETTGAEDTSASVDLPQLRLIDDTLGEAFELRKDIQVCLFAVNLVCAHTDRYQDMHDLLASTQDTWKQAAQGTISLAAATFLTHAAFAEFEEIESHLKVLCDPLDPGSLRSKYMQLEEETNTASTDGDELNLCPKQMLENLREFWLAINEMKLGGPRFLPKVPPTQFILRQCSGTDSRDKECVSTILQEIGNHMQSGILHNSVVRIGSPVYPDVGLFLTRDESDVNSLRCSFGLQLLVQTYKSFLFSSPPQNLPSLCRLKALKFAQEGCNSIMAVLNDPTMPCRCPNTLANHLERLQSDFNSFLQTKVFDLYFQSPWVSGSHVLEMLDALFRHGLRLFNYRAYITSILHVYNVLQQLTGLAPIPVFERLIDSSLGSIIFPGGRPSNSFKACYTRSVGARLQFDSHNHKGHHKSGSHSMRIPARAAKATAGFSISHCEASADHRFDIEKISKLHYIKSQGYHAAKANLTHIYEADKFWQRDTMDKKSPKQRKSTGCTHSQNPTNLSCCPVQRLHQLDKAIALELTGPSPVAKINLFTVYLASVHIISAISDEYHAMFESAKPGQHCLCFVDDILSAGERCSGCEKIPFGHKGLVDICKTAMVTKMAGKDLEDFFWKGI